MIRHDNKPLQNPAAAQAVQAGRSSIKGDALYVKGDWAELVSTYGPRAWNALVGRCPRWLTDVYRLYEFEGSASIECPFKDATHDHNDIACTACEISGTITAPLKREIMKL